MDGLTVKRSVTVGLPSFTYTAAQIVADFGSDPGTFTVRISQISTVFGAGAKLLRTFNV